MLLARLLLQDVVWLLHVRVHTRRDIRRGIGVHLVRLWHVRLCCEWSAGVRLRHVPARFSVRRAVSMGAGVRLRHVPARFSVRRAVSMSAGMWLPQVPARFNSRCAVSMLMPLARFGWRVGAVYCWRIAELRLRAVRCGGRFGSLP